MDGSLIKVHDVLHNGQPKAGSALFPAASLVHPVKPFENPVQAFLRNPHSVIPYPDYHAAALLPDINPHLAARMIVLDRIAQQVGEKFLHLLYIGPDAERLAVRMEEHLAGRCLWFQAVHDFLIDHISFSI